MHAPVLPQRATPADADVASVEWLFEPMWPGTRLMARLERGRLMLTDERGQPAGDELREASQVIAAAVRAERALIDGVWTAQPFVGDGSRRAFVAVDLVELNGEPLHDVPLQERRRLLESVIEEAVQVRVSPAVKQPLSGWLAGWRANGFTHYLAKHINSRYHPGERNEDWLQIPLRIDAPSGFVARLVGGRARRARRVDDRPAGARDAGAEPRDGRADRRD